MGVNIAAEARTAAWVALYIGWDGCGLSAQVASIALFYNTNGRASRVANSNSEFANNNDSATVSSTSSFIFYSIHHSLSTTRWTRQFGSIKLQMGGGKPRRARCANYLGPLCQ